MESKGSFKFYICNGATQEDAENLLTYSILPREKLTEITKEEYLLGQSGKGVFEFFPFK